VGQEAPGRGIPLGRKEVAPVLPDEPRAEQGGDLGATRELPQLGDPAREEDREHGQAQCEFVDSEAADVEARAKSMPFEAKHGVKLAADG
jgi:hypothetical protein